MDGLQLRDEAVRDRIRLAEEFLDPSRNPTENWFKTPLTILDDARARRFLLLICKRHVGRKLTMTKLPRGYHSHAQSRQSTIDCLLATPKYTLNAYCFAGKP